MWAGPPRPTHGRQGPTGYLDHVLPDNELNPLSSITALPSGGDLPLMVAFREAIREGSFMSRKAAIETRSSLIR